MMMGELPDDENLIMTLVWSNLPIDIGVAEIIGSLLSKVDTATSDQSEPIVNLQLD